MFAVLHIADFALHAVLRIQPGDQPGQAAALFSNAGKKSVVIAANPVARACGVELSMTAPQAVARCPALVIRAPRPAAEIEARAALLTVGFTLSPSVEDTAPGVCTIDIKGRGPEKILTAAEGAVAELQRLGLPATAGIAATPLLALYAARHCSHHRALALNRARARSEPEAISLPVGANSIKSTTEVVLHVSDPASFLAPLPLSAADPAPELAGVLHGWGLRTLGDLAALPRDEIVRRFGSEGLALWVRATGGAPRPLHPVIPSREFSARMDLEHEVESLEPLLFILRRFLDRLSLELCAAQHVAAELELTLRLEDESESTHRLRLPEPTAGVEILFRALHTRLEPLRTEACIVGVQLRLVPTRPLVRQHGLFDTGLRDPHGFAETLARVSALVGSDRIGTPQLVDTHRPDTVKLTPPTTVIPPPAEAPLHPPLGVPLRRFRPPLPARLEFTNGRATYLWTEHVHGEISAQSDPWPISGGWWEKGLAWRRTEWDIALAHGGLYRLFRANQAYYLEGEYD